MITKSSSTTLAHIPRQYKVDVMIFASALSRGAHKFLFADGDFVGMSEGQSIKMVDVTKLHVQTVLPPPA